MSLNNVNSDRFNPIEPVKRLDNVWRFDTKAKPFFLKNQQFGNNYINKQLRVVVFFKKALNEAKYMVKPEDLTKVQPKLKDTDIVKVINLL